LQQQQLINDELPLHSRWTPRITSRRLRDRWSRRRRRSPALDAYADLQLSQRRSLLPTPPPISFGLPAPRRPPRVGTALRKLPPPWPPALPASGLVRPQRRAPRRPPGARGRQDAGARVATVGAEEACAGAAPPPPTVRRKKTGEVELRLCLRAANQRG
jgi:hypothetical protein